eukprot:41235-Pyramimonas_sp.AAC.1
MAEFRKCSCGEFNTKSRRTCNNCGEAEPPPRPWNGGPKGADFWMQRKWPALKQGGWKPWAKQGGAPQAQWPQPAAGATLSPSDVKE